MKSNPICWSLVLLVAAGQSFAGERPRLVIECPTPQFKLAPDQPLILKGHVTPAVSDVRFRLLREQVSGFEALGKTKTRINGDGAFLLRLFPTDSGWPLGEFLVEAQLEQMGQVREMIQIVVVEDETRTKPEKPCPVDDAIGQPLADKVTLSMSATKTQNANPGEENTYSRDSNLIIDGEIQGPLPKTVEVRLVHVATNGRTRSLGGAAVVPSSGRFEFDSNCWLGRWPAGIVRATVSVPNSLTKSVSHDFRFVADEQPHPQKLLFTIPPSSGVVIPEDNRRQRIHRVAIGKSFLVTGWISTLETPHENQLIGPRTNLSVRSGNFIWQSAGGFSLREFPGVHWYEIEVGPLPFAGPHTLEIRRGKEVIRVIDLEAVDPAKLKAT